MVALPDLRDALDAYAALVKARATYLARAREGAAHALPSGQPMTGTSSVEAIDEMSAHRPRLLGLDASPAPFAGGPSRNGGAGGAAEFNERNTP